MKLRLVREPDGSPGVKRQRHVFYELRRNPKRIDRRHLRLDFSNIRQRVYKRIPILEITINLCCKSAVFRDCFLIRPEISCRCLPALRPQQAVVNQPVLRGNLRRRIFRNPAADGICLHKQIVHTGKL